MALIPFAKSLRRKTLIDLNGPQGNAWVLLGTARGACKQLGMNFEPIRREMMSGNYRHLVETFDKHFGRFFDLVLPRNWDEYQ